MAVRVIDSQGRRAGLPGRRASIYTVGKYGGMLTNDYQLGCIAYRSVTQTIAPSTWAPVVFDVFYQADPAAYGMWTGGASVLIVENDWYFLSATVQFAAISSYNTYQRFRFALSTGIALPGDTTYVQNQYSFPMSCGLPWYLTAGTTLTLDVSHSHSASMTLNGGLNQAVLKIKRLTG